VVHQLNIFLLAFGALQGALLSFFLLRKKEKDVSKGAFVVFLLVIGLQLTFKVVAKGWLIHNVNLLYWLSYSLPLLIGPSIYLFIRSRERDTALKATDLLHVIPFVVYFVHILIGELFNVYFIRLYTFYTQFLSLFAYGFASWMIVRKSDTRGLKDFILLVVICETVILITIILMVRNIRTFPDVRWLFVTLTLLIYWISYKVMTQPALFAQKERTVALKPETVVKYAHSGLKTEHADRIESLLRDAIYKQQVFLESSVTIDTMSVRLKVPKHHLSRVINERFRKTFNELVHDWRLGEARSRLTDPKYRKLTISTIALDCGFNSVPGFNTMFRRKYQSTPSAYRQLYYNREMTA